jgi:D-alanine-D-alanine ligase
MTENTGNKLRIAILFGGRSGEHEVSLMSARSVLSVLDKDKYEVTQVGITLDGRWFTGPNALECMEKETTEGLEHVILSPDPSEHGLYVLRGPALSGAEGMQYAKLTDIDVFFPVMHGTYSEDGTMQGMLEMADVAYVGAGVVGSSVGMDKGIFKDVMLANDIPVVDTLVVLRREIEAGYGRHHPKSGSHERLSLSLPNQPIWAPPSASPNATTVPTCRKGCSKPPPMTGAS